MNMKTSASFLVLAVTLILLGASFVKYSFENPSDLLDFFGKMIVGIFGFCCIALIGYKFALEQNKT